MVFSAHNRTLIHPAIVTAYIHLCKLKPDKTPTVEALRWAHSPTLAGEILAFDNC